MCARVCLGTDNSPPFGCAPKKVTVEEEDDAKTDAELMAVPSVKRPRCASPITVVEDSDVETIVIPPFASPTERSELNRLRIEHMDCQYTQEKLAAQVGDLETKVLTWEVIEEHNHMVASRMRALVQACTHTVEHLMESMDANGEDEYKAQMKLVRHDLYMLRHLSEQMRD